MSSSPSGLFVAVSEEQVCVRINGRANFTASIDFKKLINSLRDLGHKAFTLDLTECMNMDSTFLGVVACIAMDLKEDGAAPKIVLLNASERVADLLDNLGVLHLFDSQDGDAAPAGEFVSHESKPPKPTRKEISQHTLEAHETLMEINPDNVAKFKDVTSFLKDDLKKMD